MGGGNATFSDVTSKCSVEWYSPPKACYPFLEVTNASGEFQDGETVTGQMSGASAMVFSSCTEGGRVYVDPESVSGTFVENEVIEGSSTQHTATFLSLVPKREWPNNLVNGAFPDSVLTLNENDYVEFESTLPASGDSSFLRITLPGDEDIIATVLLNYGVGEKIDSKNVTRTLEALFYKVDNVWGCDSEPLAKAITTTYDRELGFTYTPGFC